VLGRDMQDGKPGGLEGAIHEGVPRAAIGTLMGRVVELDGQDWRQVPGAAEHEVDVFPIDLVPVGPELLGARGHGEHVPQAHFREDRVPALDGLDEHAAEGALRAGEKRTITFIW